MPMKMWEEGDIGLIASRRKEKETIKTEGLSASMLLLLAQSYSLHSVLLLA